MTLLHVHEFAEKRRIYMYALTIFFFWSLFEITDRNCCVLLGQPFTHVITSYCFISIPGNYFDFLDSPQVRKKRTIEASFAKVFNSVTLSSIARCLDC